MVSAQEIRKMAGLSRLALPEQEIETLAKECSELLESFSGIQELSLSGEVSSHFLNGSSPFRQDKVDSQDQAKVEEIFQNFPFKRGRFVKVPKSRGLVK